MKKLLVALMLLNLLNLQSQNLKNDGGIKDEEEEIYNYDSETDLENFEILDSLTTIRLFASGENHFYRVENSHLELMFLKYLHKKHNVRNLVIELGYSRGYMLNQYINGDTTYFELMKQTTSKVFLHYYKKMKDWNMELSAEKRITIHGVDIERFSFDGAIMISKLLPNYKKVPKEISLPVEAIHSIAKYYTKDLNDEYYGYSTSIYENNERTFNQNTLDSFIKSYYQYKNLYNELSKENSATLEKVVNSMKEYLYWVDNKKSAYSAIIRERIFYENIKKLMSVNNEAKFYGQFGKCHVALKLNNIECSTFDHSPLLTRFVEDSLGNQVASIAIFYAKKRTNKSSSSSSSYNSSYFNQFNSQFENYHTVKCNSTNALYKVKEDDSVLNKLYNYIIVNDVCDYTLSKDIKKPYTNTKKLNWYQSFSFNAIQNNFNFYDLNRVLFNDTVSFNNAMNSFTGDFTFSEDFFYSFGIGSFAKQKLTHNANHHELSGTIVNMKLGYDFAIFRGFNLLLYTGFQQNFLKLTSYQTQSRNFPFNIKSNDIIKSRNNGSNILAGLDFRMALGNYFFLEGGANLQYDLSDKKWTVNGIVTPDNPYFSHNSIAIKLGLGFYWY